MRRLLISTAALALLAAPTLFSSAWAQPDHPDHGDRAQAGQPPQQGGGHEHGGGGGNRAAQAPAAAAAPQAVDHNGHGHRPGPQMAAPQGRGDRGMAHTNTLPPGSTPPAGTPAQSAPQARGNGQDNRNNFQDRGGQNNGRDFNRSDNSQGNRPNNYQGNNRGAGNPGYGGPRHDFSNFRDFHRSFNASRRFRGPDYRRPAGWYEHRWTFGEFLPSAFWARDYWLDDFSDYGLPPPPYGAIWVRVGNDALLVDQDSGEVITVEYGVFY
jgi:Ni/Co efflux regulator RcnB